MSDVDPFASAGAEDDPFDDAPQVSAYPKLEQLRGRLLLVKPTKLEEHILTKFGTPTNPQYQDRITADVYVVDGPSVEGFDGESEFLDMYLSNDRLVKQLRRNIGGRMVLGRLETFEPGKKAMAGNPWGFQEATAEDKGLARVFWKARSQPKPAAAPTNPFA